MTERPDHAAVARQAATLARRVAAQAVTEAAQRALALGAAPVARALMARADALQAAS